MHLRQLFIPRGKEALTSLDITKHRFPIPSYPRTVYSIQCPPSQLAIEACYSIRTREMRSLHDQQARRMLTELCPASELLLVYHGSDSSESGQATVVL